MKKVFLSVLSLLTLTIVNAQSRPKLVVGIVVDQMRWDYLYRFADRWQTDGFQRLLQEGYNCQNTYLNYVPSYTAPGHSSIYSGAVPAIHGIVGNDWIDPQSHQRIYCAYDASVHGIGSTTEAGKMSPRAMKTDNIGDELRLSNQFRSRVFGLALKDRGAIFPAGHSANGAFWLDDSAGKFISSSYYYSQQLPQWLQDFNAEARIDHFLKYDWSTRYPISSYQQSTADDNAYEYLRAGESKPIFPHKVDAKNHAQIRSLPAGNTLSFEAAKALIKGEQLGMKDYTDMLCLSLSASDYIGHAYGPNSIELEDTYLNLDEDIASFLHFLDKYIGKNNYLLFLSADHGAAHNTTFLQDQKIPAGNLSEDKLYQTLNSLLYQQFKHKDLIIAVMNYEVVLNDSLIANAHLDRPAIKEAIIQFCKKQEGIAQAIDLEQLPLASIPEPLKIVLQNGYYAARCGSIGLIYQPAWYSNGTKGTTHGTWNPYDAHIPLLWYGWHIPSGESFASYKVTDIAATLAALLHIQAPNGASGQVIHFKD